MSNYDDDMMVAYDHYQNTGELSEYFEDDNTYCVTEPNSDNIPDDTFCLTDDNVEQKLDDVIEYLKRQIKEKEKAIKSQNKKHR